MSDNLNLKSGLSDSEASSGSGTGTPPPPHHPHPPSHLSFQGCTLILDPGFNLRLKSPLMFKETKSNPGSPTNSEQQQQQQFRQQCDYRLNEFSGSGGTSNPISSRLINPSHEESSKGTLNVGEQGAVGGQGMSVSSLGFRSGCVPTDLNVSCCYGGQNLVQGSMTRSKSLDDLNYAAFLLQDSNSSCSSDAFGFSSANPGAPSMSTSSQYDVQQQQQQQQQQMSQPDRQQVQQQQQFSRINDQQQLPDTLASSTSINCGQQLAGVVVSNSSINLGPSSLDCSQLGHQPQSVHEQQPLQLLQPNNSQVSSSSCDSLFDSVVQRIGRLEM